MNKISIYVLLVLIFLGLSKSFSPSEQGTKYLANKRVYSNYFQGAPLSLVLLDSFQTGFLIKTYFQKYRVIHGFNKTPQTVIVRTSREYWKSNLENVGMSLFRRKEKDAIEETLPMPPGTLYIGNPAYGNWLTDRSGQKIWVFHRAYQHFPGFFSWGEFLPTFQFFKRLQIHRSHEKPFYGLKNEFGKDGSITKANIIGQSKENIDSQVDLKSFFAKYIELPKWNKLDEGKEKK